MRPPPDGGPPPLDPSWEPLEGGGIGATMMSRWARSWAWKGGEAQGGVGAGQGMPTR